jgi:HTH-type transcriptional regulator/antitoxin MqsA
MKCPFCGKAELNFVIRDMPFAYQGASTMIPDVKGQFCDACGELIMSREETDRVGAAMKAFQGEVDARRGQSVK